MIEASRFCRNSRTLAHKSEASTIRKQLITSDFRKEKHIMFIKTVSTVAILAAALHQTASAEGLRTRDLAEEAAEVTVDREVGEDGMPPAGRRIADLPAPVAPKDGDGRNLAVACTSCYWNSYYGYITLCCDHEGDCGYFYC